MSARCLGIDVGTSATRVSLVGDGQTMIASASYDTVRSSDGSAEQNHEARRHHVPYIGGALTPTEVLAAMRADADAVKVFPVGPIGGASYLRALMEPLPGLRAVPSGGVAAGEVAGYFAAGGHAVCLGGALIDRQAARRSDVDAVAAHARIALDRISKAARDAEDR